MLCIKKDGIKIAPSKLNIFEKAFRAWYKKANALKMQKKMENSLFPQDMLIYEMAKYLANTLSRVNLNLRKNNGIQN